ncbi:GNAT family N-acetyltransferase [Mesobacillus subterraneus]|uniref:GNAT family N-acetyltransferase n=1 Tax=Mesobacillus subterraneus TaxID=285983 RepID=A0A3R9E953_9BACI|nr:GNAT family N-acetyltransferase [Mesobacillus subterraneus]RSD28784.1 GNAT family N-acetyltransferase [Mesobacillus subterraneus]
MTVSEREAVSLRFYESDDKSKLSTYSLLEEQMKYTALPIAALEKCETEPDRHPILILYGEQLAGFFVLHGWDGVKEFSENKNAILLRAYSINTEFQGKGIGTESIRLLPSFVKQHFEKINEIILAVNHGNMIAQNLYKKAGFVDQGNRVMGSQGEMFIYHIDLR